MTRGDYTEAQIGGILRRLEHQIDRAKRRGDTANYIWLVQIRDGSLYGPKDQGQWKPDMKETCHD